MSTWLDEQTWTGRIDLDGWRVGSGGERAVTEPATGTELYTETQWVTAQSRMPSYPF